jgi:hypothetical protein
MVVRIHATSSELKRESTAGFSERRLRMTASISIDHFMEITAGLAY